MAESNSEKWLRIIAMHSAYDSIDTKLGEDIILKDLTPTEALERAKKYLKGEI